MAVHRADHPGEPAERPLVPGGPGNPEPLPQDRGQRPDRGEPDESSRRSDRRPPQRFGQHPGRSRRVGQRPEHVRRAVVGLQGLPDGPVEDLLRLGPGRGHVVRLQAQREPDRAELGPHGLPLVGVHRGAERVRGVGQVARQRQVDPGVGRRIQGVVAPSRVVDALDVAVDVDEPASLDIGAPAHAVEEPQGGQVGVPRPFPRPAAELGVVADPRTDHRMCHLQQQSRAREEDTGRDAEPSPADRAGAGQRLRAGRVPVRHATLRSSRRCEW